MTDQQETKKEAPKKKSKSLLHNPDRAKARKESKKRMKAKTASEIKAKKPISLDEVLR